MKNPLRKYIDKRIEETLRRKEREALEEKWRIDTLQAKRKKEDELANRAKQYIDKLLTDGTCGVLRDGNDGVYEAKYGNAIPWDERPSTIVCKHIRQSIVEDIMTRLFTEKLGESWTNYTTFSLSEGLKTDLQKLHNIKPKEK